MGDTIYPTHSCFDDAVDIISAAVMDNPQWALDHLRVVHGICLAPEGPLAGTEFAHGWVEQDKDIVIQAGIVHGKRVFYGCGRKEHYKLLRVRLTTVYTLKEVAERNRETYHTGPWEPAYRALCGNGTRQRFEEGA